MKVSVALRINEVEKAEKKLLFFSEVVRERYSLLPRTVMQNRRGTVLRFAVLHVSTFIYS